MFGIPPQCPRAVLQYTPKSQPPQCFTPLILCHFCSYPLALYKSGGDLYARMTKIPEDQFMTGATHEIDSTLVPPATERQA